jgi:DNA-binding CsgD family transcriptional regulator
MVAANNPGWDLLISRAIEGLGDKNFFKTLCADFQEIVRLNKGNLILAYQQHNQPGVLAHSLAGNDLKLHVDNYLAGLYLLDPFYQAAANGLPSGFYKLDDLAPDDFYETEYFHRYYQAGNINDDLGYCFDLGDVGRPGDHIHISFASTRDEELDEEQIGCLREKEPVVRALVLKHLRLTDNAILTRPDSNLHRQLMQVMSEFGSSILTNRERQVLQLILHGHSSQSIADKLDIALRTVKLHRQNLYQKLDIGSQAELFYLFIDSLTCLDSGDGFDPLSAYFQPPP